MPICLYAYMYLTWQRPSSSMPLVSLPALAVLLNMYPKQQYMFDQAEAQFLHTAGT